MIGCPAVCAAALVYAAPSTTLARKNEESAGASVLPLRSDRTSGVVAVSKRIACLKRFWCSHPVHRIRNGAGSQIAAPGGDFCMLELNPYRLYEQRNRMCILVTVST